MRERMLFVHFAVESVPSRFISLPTHITLLSWFEIKTELRAPLIEAVRFIVQSFPPIHTVAAEEAWFGRREEVLVNVLKYGPHLQELHMSLLELVSELGGDMSNLEWSGVNYRPHITRKPDLAFCPGDEFILRRLSLVRAVSEQPKLREVVEHFHW